MEARSREEGGTELTPINPDDYKQFFDRLDTKKDGLIPIDVFVAALKSEGRRVPPKEIRDNFKRADGNGDKLITFDEFMDMMKSKGGSKYKKAINSYIHHTVRRAYITESDDTLDGEYEDEYTCYPPKLCMVIISFIEIALFVYDWALYGEIAERIGDESLAHILVYDPSRRIEVWRYISYMFVHIGIPHLFVNLLVQILLGVPLELVHGNFRVLCIYIAGVVAGSLGTSVFDPSVYLAGASGGVYALMTAHIASILMNWAEMKYALHQLLVFGTLIFVDVGTALAERYEHSEDETKNPIGYVAHLAGAVTGLLVGISVLKNLRVKSWEIKLWWFSLVLYVILMLTAITVNVAFPSHFPIQKV